MHFVHDIPHEIVVQQGNDFGLMAGGFGGPQSPGGPGGPRPPYGGSSSYPYSQDPYAAGAYGASGAGAGAEPYGTSEQDQMKKLLKDTFLEVEQKKLTPTKIILLWPGICFMEI